MNIGVATMRAIHLSQQTHDRILELASKTHQTPAHVVETAVRLYCEKLAAEQAREQWRIEMAESWERLRNDPVKWAAYQREVEDILGN